MLDWSQVISGGIGGGVILALQLFARMISSEVAKRVALTSWGIRAFDAVTPKFLQHSMWSGKANLTWQSNSTTFDSKNTASSEIHRCFNYVSFNGYGNVASGSVISYRFIGKLSRDKTILTGTWFEERGQTVGYHGVFQLRTNGNGCVAEGVWAGFSETKFNVNADVLKLEKTESFKLFQDVQSA